MTTKKKRTYTAEQRKANADRQRQYREKHLKDEKGTKARLSTIIDHRAALALKRLATHYGVTQAELLEPLLMAAQDRVLDTLDADGQVADYVRQRYRVMQAPGQGTSKAKRVVL